MVIKRSVFFLVLASFIIIPVATKKLIWIAGTSTTTGEMAFEGKGNALDQIRPTYSVIFFNNGKDTTWFDAKGILDYKPGASVPVRYTTNNPRDATVNTTLGLWAESLIYAGLPLILIIVMFLHSEIVPKGQRIKLSKKKPVITLVDHTTPG